MNIPPFLIDLERQLETSATALRSAWITCKANNMHKTASELADTVLDIEESLKTVKREREQLERGIQ